MTRHRLTKPQRIEHRRIAQKKWRNRHSEKARYDNYRSCAVKFITKLGSKSDVNRLIIAGLQRFYEKEMN